MNRLFISTTFTSDQTPLRQALDLCGQLNVCGVELGSNHCYQTEWSFIQEFPFTYLVHNYFPIPEDSFVMNIASWNPWLKNRSIEHAKKAIDFCKKFGANLYTFHPGFLTDPHGSNQNNKNYDFQWDETQLKKINHEETWDLMLDSVHEIVNYAKKVDVQIAFETEGSLLKKDHLLMQRPQEYKRFFKDFSPQEIGVNLNIGHLNLASNAFGFKKDEFVNLVAEYVVAMELSHNDGQEDQHLPLIANEWYWPLINDQRFENVYKILEFRNSSTGEIRKVLELMDDYHK